MPGGWPDNTGRWERAGLVDPAVPSVERAVDPSVRAANRRWNRLSSQKITLRSRDEVASLVAGLEVVPPGLVHACEWRPAPDDPSFDEVIPLYGVVARKP
jgi:hypothetical protein